jgi:hypothetical protein
MPHTVQELRPDVVVVDPLSALQAKWQCREIGHHGAAAD